MTDSNILKMVKDEDRLFLMEHESKLFLEQQGIPVIETRFASTQDEAVSFADQIGYPVVLKVVSPEIIHKSDVEGVILNLTDAEQVKVAYRSLMGRVKKAMPSANILGVSVEEMAKPSIEVALGLTRDKQFGPVIMFGLGGILIEVLKDVTFRVCPVNQDEALEMMKETKGFQILNGYRGLPPADLKALATIIVKFSKIGLEYPEIDQADLNPIMVNGSEIKVADARIILSG